MDIKTWWTFDPAYPETTRERLEVALAGALAVWITRNYSALRDSLERKAGAKSAALCEGAPTNLVVQGESVWMSTLFTPPVTSSRAASIQMQRRRSADLRVRAEEEQREQNQINCSREFLICASFLNEAFKALKRSLAEMVFQAMNVM